MKLNRGLGCALVVGGAFIVVSSACSSEPKTDEPTEGTRTVQEPLENPPRAKSPDGLRPAEIYNAYVRHKPPPLSATGSAAASQVHAFIDWAAASKPDEREDGRGVLAKASSNDDVAKAFIDEYNAAATNDHSAALLVLALLGELKNQTGETFLISITKQTLPTTGTTLADGEILERSALERLQMKAAAGIAYRKTATGDAEIFRILKSSPSAAVRAEAVRVYVYNHPSDGAAKLKPVLASSDLVYLDRVEHGPDGPSMDSFNARLATFLQLHPELKAPDLPRTQPAHTGSPPGTDIKPPSSSNPIP